ncbi:hypothetical protein [Microbacterium sp. SSM24]|uniref:hypothetical protein n=1 Tax=Microbacterium sp. SSM24 TaxID=2991714 RepID=UPI002227CD2D|nr:hypothetical protein [Microbacterium sp. SSM24]MCW3493596.1 hypothetical protein [Microbacterium sp. SSM24]
MEQHQPMRRVIRMFPDYGRDYPLWENSTPTWDVGYTTTPADYGLSEELGAELGAWQAFWEEHANSSEEWDTDDNLRAWLRRGEALARRVQTEVSEFADVQIEFGPRPRRL